MSWIEEDRKKNERNAEQQGNLFEDDVETQLNTSNIQNGSSKEKMDGNRQLWLLLEKTLDDNLVERRRARRWKIFLYLSRLVVVLGIIGFWFSQFSFKGEFSHQSTVALIPMRGVIGSGAGIDANEYVGILNEVYRNPQLKGVIIELNSAGGSPVHSGIIYDAIRKREKQFPHIPVVVVVEDIAASGGYYIASAANEIYVNRASLLGSIGVISSGLDASGLIKKLGIERRVFIAGKNKDFLDPFVPMTKESKEKWQAVLDQTHQQFINAVKMGRGDRLKITGDVFSGMVFTGEQAQKIGLIDGLASLNDVLNSHFPNDKQVTYGPKRDSLNEIAKKFGAEFVTRLFNTVIIQ